MRHTGTKTTTTTSNKYVKGGSIAGNAYENLVKANCEKKSCLVFLLAFIVRLIFLQPVLICVKLNHVLDDEGLLQDSDWIFILIPWWILHGFYILLLISVVPLTGCNSVLVLRIFENISWFLGPLILTLRWDITVFLNYTLAFIPIYIAIGLRAIAQWMAMRQLSCDIN